VNRRNAYLLGTAVAAVMLVLCCGTVVLPLMMLGEAQAEAATCYAPQQVSGQQLTTEQLASAQTIVATTQAQQLPEYAAVVALATAKQESDLVNSLVATDHDSIGLFQQRISVYTAAVAGDPVRSTQAFLAALDKVPNWQTIPLTQAAQAVQKSSHGDAYAQWQALATALATKFWLGAALTNCNGGDGLPDGGAGGIPDGYHLPTDAQQAAAVAFALAQLGKPYVFGAEGPNAYDCSGLMMAAWAAAGVAVPRTTYDQANVGVAVPGLATMQPGDLLFIPGSDGTAAHPGHVGMYIGVGGDNRQYLVQAPHIGTVVKVIPVSDWASQVAAIRRPVTH